MNAPRFTVDVEGLTVLDYRNRPVEVRAGWELIDTGGQSLSISLPFWLPTPPVDVDSPGWKAFYALVQRDLLKQSQYKIEAYEHALVYAITKDERHRQKALAEIAAYLTSEIASMSVQVDRYGKVDPTGTPRGYPIHFAGNQFLNSGRDLEQLAAAYAWCDPPEPLKSEVKAFADQGVHNIWNPDAMSWAAWPNGRVLYAERSRVGLANALDDNYFLSFFSGTEKWAFGSNSKQLVDFLRGLLSDPESPRNLFGVYRKRTEGGSREGSQYGEAPRGVFECAELWQQATGETVDLGVWPSEMLRYWINATTPDFSTVVPIGDFTRTRKLDGYHRDMIRSALDFVPPDSAEANAARWWLESCGLPPHQEEFTNVPPGKAEPLQETHYYAPTVGHFFYRTSWQRDAALMTAVVGGPLGKGHAHPEHGNISLYQLGWVIVTQNWNSIGGLKQDAKFQNNLRIEDGGVPFRQDDDWNTTELEYSLNGDVLTLRMKLDEAYVESRSGKPLGLTAHSRVVEWHTGENRVVISDDYWQADPRFTVYSQLQSPNPSRVKLLSHPNHVWESWGTIDPKPGEYKIDKLTGQVVGYRLSLPEATRVEFTVD